MAICKNKIKLNNDVNIVIKDSTESTNSDAKKMYKEIRQPTLVIAEEQTAGRGRLDRKFVSPRGKGIYMSFVFDPKKYFENINIITPFAAVAVSRAIDKVYNTKTGIKWVNDIYLNKKKICGILSEIIFEGQTPDFLIVGVGINVHKFDFPKELENIATSIEEETNMIASRNEIISEFINEFLSVDNEKEYINEYREKSVIIGKNVTVFSGKESFKAYAENIDEDGNLVVMVNGEIRKINAGEVSIRL